MRDLEPRQGLLGGLLGAIRRRWRGQAPLDRLLGNSREKSAHRQFLKDRV